MRYDFEFRYAGQESEGFETVKNFTWNCPSVEDALIKYAIAMGIESQADMDWVLIGTTINGQRAEGFIQREKEMKNDIHNIHMSDTPREPKIPTPEELRNKIRGKVAAQNIGPITDAIVKAMLDGEKYALIPKDKNGADKHWDTIFPLLAEKFRARGWVIASSSVSQESGPDYQSFKRDYYKITWADQTVSRYSDF